MGAILASTLQVAAQTPATAPTPTAMRGGTPAQAPVRQASYTTGTVTWLTEDPQAPPPAPPANPIQPVVMQRPMMDRNPAPVGDDAPEPHIRLTPPGPEMLFRRDSENQLLERIRQEALSQSKPERIEFPREHEELTKQRFSLPAFPPGRVTPEPNYTCYKRLYFEQLNAERQGWDLGFIAPFVSAGVFFKDVVLLPYHMGTEPCRRYECNTGYCLPGTPTPLLLYPPEFSLTGLLLEATVVTGIMIVFPG